MTHVFVRHEEFVFLICNYSMRVKKTEHVCLRFSKNKKQGKHWKTFGKTPNSDNKNSF